MPVHEDDSGRRRVEMEFVLPGTPEQVWQAMATGEGMTCWFTPTMVDEKLGGAIEFDLGDDVSRGTVTEWDPPTRFGYEERDWSGEAPPLATEVVITSRSGDSCVVRLVHSLFTSRDDWDDEMESFEVGWAGCFDVLRLYLANFAGQPASTVRVAAVSSAPADDVWARLTEALALDGVTRGDPTQTPEAAPRLSGVVEQIRHSGNNREILLLVDEPSPGIVSLGSCPVGDQTHASVGAFFYGDDVAGVAADQQIRWTDWLHGQVNPGAHQRAAGTL